MNYCQLRMSHSDRPGCTTDNWSCLHQKRLNCHVSQISNEEIIVQSSNQEIIGRLVIGHILRNTTCVPKEINKDGYSLRPSRVYILGGTNIFGKLNIPADLEKTKANVRTQVCLKGKCLKSFQISLNNVCTSLPLVEKNVSKCKQHVHFVPCHM